MIKIVIDCFGGDHSPKANIDGALRALKSHSDLYIILSGDETAIKDELKDKKYDSSRIEILHAPEVIGCDEKPTEAIRTKKESSMMKAINLLRNDDSVKGLVSVGSSGALIAGSVIRVGRLQGVIRPAFCPLMPAMNGGFTAICDSGANVECTPEELQQFSVMGSLYMEKVYGINNPKVALLNVGVESNKGDELHKEAYKLLESTPGINFVGNMESRDVLTGKYDLVVCDGFSGNVLVKSTEGACLEMLKRLKKDINSRFINKIGAFFLRKMFMQEKEFLNYQNYGGSVLLGTKKIIVKGHGSSKEKAIEACIEQAYKMESSGFSQAIEESLCALPSARI